MQDILENFMVTEKEEAILSASFYKCVFQCLISCFDKSCKLSKPERRNYIKEILNDEMTINTKKYFSYRLSYLPFNFVLLVIKSRIVPLNMIMSKMGSAMLKITPYLVERLKNSI